MRGNDDGIYYGSELGSTVRYDGHIMPAQVVIAIMLSEVVDQLNRIATALEKK